MGTTSSNGAVLDPGESGGATAQAVMATSAGADFAATVTTYETPLLRYAARFVGAEEAQDLVQEAFLRLHRHLKRHGADGIRSTSSWLYRVAHNLCMDSMRRNRVRERTVDGAIREAEAPSRDEAEGLGQLVRRAAGERALSELSRLPGKQKQMILLKVVQEMSMTQIAEVTGMSIGNVGYHLNQALATLAARLKAAGVM